MAGIERRRGQRGHRLQIAFEALADALAMPTKNVALALAAAPLEILVERFEARKVRQRDHEVAPRPAHQTLHRPLVVALARTPVPVPDEVVREKSAEKPRPAARPVALEPRHKTPVVVVEHRQRDRTEQRECVHVPVDPRLGRRRGVRPNVRRVALRQVEGEEMDLALDPGDVRPRFAEITLPMPRRMNQRHVHLPAPAMMLANVVLHDRVPAGEAVLVAKTLENALRRVLLLAMVVVAVPAQPLVDESGESIELGTAHRGRAPVPRRNAELEHLPHALARDTEMARRRALAHPVPARQTYLAIQLHGVNPPALPVTGKGRHTGRVSLRRDGNIPPLPWSSFAPPFATEKNELIQIVKFERSGGYGWT